MSVYLVQHITNNLVTTNQILSFYFKLENKYNGKCINCWVDFNKNSVFFLLKAINKKTIKDFYIHSIDISPYKITLVNNILAYALANSQKKSISLLSKKEGKIIVFIQNVKHSKFDFSYKALTIIKNITNCYNAKIMAQENNYLFLNFSSIKNAKGYLDSIYKKINELDLIAKIDIKTIILKRTEDYQINKSNQEELLKLTSFIKKNELVLLSEKQEHFLQLLHNTLEESYDSLDLNLTQLCKTMMMSKTKLYRNCKTYTGKSINEILKNFRLNKALEKIKEKKKSISQISIETGFNSNSYFSNCFKKKFGVSPSTFLQID